MSPRLRRTKFIAQNCGQLLWLGDYVNRNPAEIEQIRISVTGSVDLMEPEGPVRLIYTTDNIGQSTDLEGHYSMITWFNQMSGYDQAITTDHPVAGTPIGPLFQEYVREANPQTNILSAVGTVVIVNIISRLPEFDEGGSSNECGSI